MAEELKGKVEKALEAYTPGTVWLVSYDPHHHSSVESLLDLSWQRLGVCSIFGGVGLLLVAGGVVCLRWSRRTSLDDPRRDAGNALDVRSLDV